MKKYSTYFFSLSKQKIPFMFLFFSIEKAQKTQATPLSCSKMSAA